MLPVLLQSLILASGGILSIGSITIVILLLISDRGWWKGLAYMAGYLGAYMVIGVAVVLAGYRVTEQSAGGSSLIASLLFTILGAILLWIAQRNWRNPPAETGGSPRLFALLDDITPPKAFGFGALVTVINFKNLAITRPRNENGFRLKSGT